MRRKALPKKGMFLKMKVLDHRSVILILNFGVLSTDIYIIERSEFFF